MSTDETVRLKATVGGFSVPMPVEVYGLALLDCCRAAKYGLRPGLYPIIHFNDHAVELSVCDSDDFLWIPRNDMTFIPVSASVSLPMSPDCEKRVRELLEMDNCRLEEAMNNLTNCGCEDFQELMMIVCNLPDEKVQQVEAALCMFGGSKGWPKRSDDLMRAYLLVMGGAAMTRQAKLSWAQLRALQGAAEGDPAKGVHGMAGHGGLTATLWSLRKRGLLTDDHTLTDAGKAVLHQDDKAPEKARKKTRKKTPGSMGGYTKSALPDGASLAQLWHFGGVNQ